MTTAAEAAKSAIQNTNKNGQMSKSQNMRHFLESPLVLAKLNKALSGVIPAETYLQAALGSFATNPKLYECDPVSVLGSLLQAAQLKLQVSGALGQAYIVPYGRKAQFIPGYRGLIELARRSGQVRSITAQVVYSNDDFEFSFGRNEDLNHRPAMGDRGEIIYVYAYAHLKDDGYAQEVMSVDDVKAIQARSKGGQYGPWKDHWSEMARKTVLRRLSKYLPMSIEFAKAVEMDIKHDLGETQDFSDLESQIDESIDASFEEVEN